MIRSYILVCGGTGCTSSGSQKIQEQFVASLDKYGLTEEVKLVQTGCFGHCALGPVVIVHPDGTVYSRVTPEDVDEIVSEHLLKGRVVERLVYSDTGEEATEVDVANLSLNDTAFYKTQNRVVLRNCGVIDPEDINEYIAMDGYAALGKVLTEMTPQEVIDVISDSGLRGRGGGGFPTGRKWALTAPNQADQKYVVCNKYKPHLGKLLAGKQIGPLYFRLAGKLADNASATFAVRAGDKFYTPVTVPVRSLKFPQNTPGKQPFSASITWMPEVYAMDWPDFVNVYRKTGFNGVPIFPYQWHYMKPARGSGFVEESRSFAEKVRKHNMDIIQVESAIHAIVWRGEQPCTYKGAKVFCMSYRGERFQKHLEDLKNASKLIKPAMVIWDIELVGKSFGGNMRG